MKREDPVLGPASAHSDGAAGSALSRFLQDPLGSIIAASAAAIGSLGVVLSGIWFINLAMT